MVGDSIKDRPDLEEKSCGKNSAIKSDSLIYTLLHEERTATEAPAIEDPLEGSRVCACDSLQPGFELRIG